MKTNELKLIVTVAFAGLMSACATAVPAQLLEARDSYAAASSGLPGRLAPNQLYDAKQVLDRANHEFDQRGDTNACRDYSYIAQNKLELADVVAQTELDRQAIVAAARARSSTGEAQDLTTSASATTLSSE
jgi:hypothetical protein